MARVWFTFKVPSTFLNTAIILMIALELRLFDQAFWPRWLHFLFVYTYIWIQLKKKKKKFRILIFTAKRRNIFFWELGALQSSWPTILPSFGVLFHLSVPLPFWSEFHDISVSCRVCLSRGLHTIWNSALSFSQTGCKPRLPYYLTHRKGRIDEFITFPVACARKWT